MMATEAPEGRSNEATVTSESEPTVTTDSHDVDSDRPHVNGDRTSTVTDEIGNRHISDIVDDLVNSAEVSISGGSDNEASKSDASKHKDDEKGHGRHLSSVKKPTSFKAINVNKTFLTTKAGIPSASPKPSEKAPPSTNAVSQATTASAARPRLIAKTGTASLTKSSTGANGGKAGSVPDASAVWNKNRPVPGPEPKILSDEELKKKYGIHMATRLHPDDNKGQANWADIDDDDEDWAPETITWKDGTKIAIPHTEEPAPQAPEPIVQPLPQPLPQPLSQPLPQPLPTEDIIREKSKSPAHGTSLSIKPGVLASGKGLVLKGAPEKPTLVAKPPAPPTPQKSPWAPLPKIEKVSPVIPEPYQHQSGARFGPKDPVQKSITPPPPKEIAADDFSRTPWREGPGAPSRELFNSHSGRYEPVTDRRGSIRTDAQRGRQPALLQRSSDHQGPAEPSPAFQTYRSSEQHNPYGRRRGSSNVSGGSGSYLHRLKGHEQSLPPPEVATVRRESFTGGSDSPASASFSPSGQQAEPHLAGSQPWQPHLSPASSNAVAYQNPSSAEVKVPTGAEASAYELQKQLMSKARAEALKRRIEEEAREEAAKKERIRLLLEGLGPAPESKSAKQAAAQNKEVAPAQEARGTGPGSLAASATEEDKKMEPGSPAAPLNTELDAKSNALPNGVASHTASHTASPQDTEDMGSQSQNTSHGHANAWPGEAKQPERYQQPSWGAQPSGKNVWGPPNPKRSLGNGTFSADLGTTQISQIANKPGPGPIAPPSTSRSSMMSQPNSASGGSIRPAPIGPPKQTPRQEQALAGGLSAEQRAARQASWVASARANDEAVREMYNKELEAQEKKLAEQNLTLADLQPVIKDTWRPTRLTSEGYRVEEKARHLIQHGPVNQWVKASSEPKGVADSPSQISDAALGHGEVGSALRSDFKSSTMLGATGTAVQQARGSRFFPSKDVRLETAVPASDNQRHTSPSPPPPDMAGHPAFDGDVTHPQVSLPGPRPVVRLPPAPGADSTPSVSTEKQHSRFSWATPAPYKGPEAPPSETLRTQRTTQPAPSAPHQSHNPGNGWQARFDNLLGAAKKSHSPAKPFSVDSTSRTAVEHPPYASAVTISFPGTSFFSRISTGNDGSAVSKVMAEEDECFEAQEMGSLPPIRLPIKVPELLLQYPAAPPPKNFLHKRFLVDATSIDTFDVTANDPDNVLVVVLPGRGRVTSLPWSLSSRTRSNPRPGSSRSRGGGGARHASQGSRGGKGRDSSSNYHKEHNAGSSGPKWQQPRSGRGGLGRREMSRNTQTPLQT